MSSRWQFPELQISSYRSHWPLVNSNSRFELWQIMKENIESEIRAMESEQSQIQVNIEIFRRQLSQAEKNLLKNTTTRSEKQQQLLFINHKLLLSKEEIMKTEFPF